MRMQTDINLTNVDEVKLAVQGVHASIRSLTNSLHVLSMALEEMGIEISQPTDEAAD